MGFFSRVGNLWKGFLSLWISDIEKDHPEIAYENAINSMIEKYAKLKSATAAIIRRRDDLDERYKKATAEMAQTEAELGTAVEMNQDDLAVVLIQKKNGLAALRGQTGDVMAKQELAALKARKAAANAQQQKTM